MLYRLMIVVTWFPACLCCTVAGVVMFVVKGDGSGPMDWFDRVYC